MLKQKGREEEINLSLSLSLSHPLPVTFIDQTQPETRARGSPGEVVWMDWREEKGRDAGENLNGSPILHLLSIHLAPHPDEETHP